MKNQLLRIIIVTAILSLVLFSWMKSRSDAKAQNESYKLEQMDSKENVSLETKSVLFTEELS